MAEFVTTDDPSAQRLVDAIRAGDHAGLRTVLAERPELATALIGDQQQARSSLHIATDWPGHFPGVATTIELLVAAGADVDAPFVGQHAERPLHWAASSNDLDALEALLVAGADLEAPGGVLTGGPPLDDAVIFDNLDCARALVAAGAQVALFHAAALGLDGDVRRLVVDAPQDHLDASLWHACHQGRTTAARVLLAAGADASFEGFADQRTIDAARAAGDAELIALVEGAI